ncbi:ABC transporter ATP-binding protein [Actinorhabdospora filicis]|uniref:ABC transporter ATP-binding protein n=1 Tax=Actinorhabdospora filicis TaxID=1785913 RepID=UPI002553B4F5|nr:ATP-binding cassette domain-containing protein [Actinorhabdospora filicis]
MTVVCEISGLRKSFRTLRRGPVVAVDGLDLVVHRGEVHGFLGPNGCGKTTTLRALLGLVRADAGIMRVFGEPLPERLPHVVNRVGAIVEAPNFFGNFTGFQTLRLLASSVGIPDARVHEVLEIVGLRDRARQNVKAYSLGMRQRLAVASALLKKPELLILDEPANGLDPAGIREMRELMQSLAANGVTVLVSSHLLGEVEQLCDTVTIVSRGRRVHTGKVADVIASQSTGDVRVLVADPEAALPVLAEAGLEAHRVNEHIVVPRMNDPAFVTRTLGEKDIWVSELVQLKPDLETVFLQLTGTAPVAGRYPQVDDSVRVPPPPLPVSAPVAETITVTPESGGPA